MKISERCLTVSPAYITIDGDFEMGQDVKVVIEGEITGIKDESNFDGTYKRVFKVKGQLSYENKTTDHT